MPATLQLITAGTNVTFISLLNYSLNGLVEGLLIALPALALTLVMGVARFANAATGDYMTVSAYGAVAAQKAIAASASAAMLGALAIGIAVSVLAGWLVFRLLRGRPFVTSLVASIGVALLTRSVLTYFVGHDPQTIEIPLMRAWNYWGIRILPTDIAVAAIALLAMALVFGILYLTPLGREMRAVADNPDLARASGIRANRVWITLWVIVGVLCAFGGVLYGAKAVVVPELGWELLIPAFAAMVAGGVGNPVGAVLAGVLLGVIQELSVPFVGPSYKIAMSFLVLLIVLLFRPRGLFGVSVSTR
ncbi:branched-chain amino acid ABC transporter permease [Paracandidimonas soli]|uniref:branched-chain amino acid ABC transporter permease n=1 Tax=Paracandidimonas soli TaxID=1917182 RepID=UPI00104AFB67